LSKVPTTKADMTHLTNLRLSYSRTKLSRKDLNPNPVEQFKSWLTEALKDNLREPYAMSLATANSAGRPSVRTVLLRGIGPDSLTFFTNYKSHKGLDLEINPQAEVLFFWSEHERQVRAYGQIRKITEAESTIYFRSRPYESQLAAHVSSTQSAPIVNRELLEERFKALKIKFPADKPVPKPSFWGGYRIYIEEWEFWQGRPNRLHDRFRYKHTAQGWKIDRLMP
jgi:pyridoxamine 5'-phosphate oxidase